MDIPMHRFKYTKLTKAQIGEMLAQTVAGPKCASELSDVLRGKSFKIVTKDGPVLNYEFHKNKMNLPCNKAVNLLRCENAYSVLGQGLKFSRILSARHIPFYQGN